MAKIPTPRSYLQILGDLVDVFLSRYGLKALKVGSPVLSMFESMSQTSTRSSQDIFDSLNSRDLDKATGTSLDKIGADEDRPRGANTAASGYVTISDASFTKKSTKIFQGLPAPILGSTTINVSDASLFPATGSVYLGRETANYEGPIAYTAKTNLGTYWTLTLSSGTRKYHNVSETVVLAQGGNRSVSSGVIVQTPQGNSTTSVQFKTLFASIVPDGEVSISNVQVQALTAGVASNVAAGSISSFVSAPFAGAVVTNPLPFTNGNAAEDDKTYREAIRNKRASRAKGTALAIQTAVKGITATDENKTLTSSSVVTRQGYPTTLYIDDGTGYEESSHGVAIETLIDVASGGEQYFTLAAAKPVAKASVVSVNQEPFNLAQGTVLAVKVGGVLYQHTFSADTFRSISNASAYEIVASINADPTLGFSASTHAGFALRLFGKEDTLEDIEVVSPAVGDDANSALLFPLGRVDTLRLYKNDRLLSKDGSVAMVSSNPAGIWGLLASGVTLQLAVDGTSVSTYTFVDQDFIDAGTGFVSCAKNSLDAWASVLNAKIPGITATVGNGVLSVVSNLGRSGRAKLNFVGGTLITTGNMFAVGVSSGTDNDYTMNRNTGQIRLSVALAAGDKLTVGTSAPRAFVQSKEIPVTTIASPGGNLWFSADGAAQVVKTGLTSSTTLAVAVSGGEYWANRLRLTSLVSTFSNVLAGDYMIAYDPALTAPVKRTWRVLAATPTYVEVEQQAMLTARQTFGLVTLLDGRVMAIGGATYSPIAVGVSTSSIISACEIYDPSTNTWSMAAPMTTPRSQFAYCVLNSGKVLVVGGLLQSGSATNLCEIYDPSTDTWSAAAALPAGQDRYAAFFCKVTSASEAFIVAGGKNLVSLALNTTYRYNPSSDTWSAGAAMPVGLAFGAGLALTTSKLITIGGVTSLAAIVNSTYVYDFNADTWTVSGNLPAARKQSTAVLLADGKVLNSGGITAVTPVRTTELYDPGAGTWTAKTLMNVARFRHTLTVQGDGNILAAGGTTTALPVSSAEIYNEGGDTWTTTTAMKVAHANGGAVTLATGNVMVVSGLSGSNTQTTSATSEIYNYSGASWALTDSNVAQPTVSLTSAGIAFVRSGALIQQVIVPVAANYTSSAFSTLINSQLSGITANTYRTKSLRIGTTTYDSTGDLGLVAQDLEGTKLNLTVATQTNSSSHQASVQSGNSQAGTPSFANESIIAGDTAKVITNGTSLTSNRFVVALKSYSGYGQNFGFVSAIAGASTVNVLRNASLPWNFGDRFFAASSLAIGPQDDLVVVVDQDEQSKKYDIPMYRKLTPVGGTYGATNTYRDADAGGASMAASFGLGFDFNDYAVYMAARGITNPSTTKAVLWRYSRIGPDGNGATVQYVYPTAPSTPTAVLTDIATNGKYPIIRVGLASTTARTGYAVRSTTSIGNAYQTAGKVLSYILGYTVSSATRAIRIDVSASTLVATEVITGATSGATATVSSVLSGSLVLTGILGTFTPGEMLNGSLTHTATAVGTQYGFVTLTLTLPTVGGGALADITNHGLPVGAGIYLQSSSGTFPTGLKAIAEVTTSTLGYVENGTVSTVASIGNISGDVTGPTSFTGASIAVGDILYVGSGSTLDAHYKLAAHRIGYLGAQVIQCTVDLADPALAGLTWTSGTVPTWTALGDASSLSIYPLLGYTAQKIAADVNNLAATVNSTCPVTAVSTGVGAILLSSYDSGLATTLTDGVNYVKTTISPGSLAGDYQLTFKDSPSAALVSNADWANEDVRLVPLTAKNLIGWLSAPAVSGLATVSSIELSDRAQKIQITSLTLGSAGAVQVQGGLANSTSAVVYGSSLLIDEPLAPTTFPYCTSTILNSASTGLFSGGWVKVQNTVSMPKAVFTSANSVLTSWTADGVVVFGGAYCFGDPTGGVGSQPNKVLQIEKQGQFVCYAGDIGTIPPEGAFVSITAPAVPTGGQAQISPANQGVFKIVRAANGNFWIENPNFVDERAEMDLLFLTADSILPGDTILINTDKWGSTNKGSYTVLTVGQVGGTGAQFANANTIKLAMNNPSFIASGAVAALGTDSSLVQVLEPAARFFKRICSITPNQANGAYVDVKFDSSASYQKIGAAAGSILYAQDKLAFPTDLAVGLDAYNNATGLIAEANRVCYGDPRNTSAYPGVVAAGADLNITGALVKRITIALAIRASGNTVDIASKVRSAVASVINKTAVGQPLAISSICTAAGKVNGVTAVSVISPVFDSANDLISVQPFEKPIVLNVEDDILITFVGD